MSHLASPRAAAGPIADVATPPRQKPEVLLIRPPQRGDHSRCGATTSERRACGGRSRAAVRPPSMAAAAQKPPPPAAPRSGKDAVGSTLRMLHSKDRRPKRWLGQHYMVDEEVTVKTLRAAGIEAGDLVLEVGPGTGALTQALVDAGATVIGVEKDPDMVSLCSQRFADCPHVQVVHEDFVRWPVAARVRAALDAHGSGTNGGTGPRAKVVANLPFNITTDVVRRLLPLGDLFSTVVLLLQDEAAQRLVDATPRPNEYRRMSLFVHFYSDPSYVFFVPRSSFLPPPNVDAAVAAFSVKRPQDCPLDSSSQKAFFSMVTSSFPRQPWYLKLRCEESA